MSVCLLLREEFSSHGLSDVVNVECRDVCRDGFGLSNVADAGEVLGEQIYYTSEAACYVLYVYTQSCLHPYHHSTCTHSVS